MASNAQRGTCGRLAGTAWTAGMRARSDSLVKVHIHKSHVAQTGCDQSLGDVRDHGLVDRAVEGIPAAPAHLPTCTTGGRDRRREGGRAQRVQHVKSRGKLRQRQCGSGQRRQASSGGGRTGGVRASPAALVAVLLAASKAAMAMGHSCCRCCSWAPATISSGGTFRQTPKVENHVVPARFDHRIAV